MTNSNFSIEEWHGQKIFSWYREEAKKLKTKTQTFVEIEKGKITISELLLDKAVPLVCAVFSATYREEIIESSRMSEAFIVKKGKMVGSADSMQGILNHLIGVMSKTLNKTYKNIHLLLPSGTLFYKMVNYPEMPESDLKAAIKNDMLHFNETKLKKEPAILRKWHIGTVDRRESRIDNYLFVGVPKAAILNYIELLSDTKISLSGFTTPQLLYFYYLNDQFQKQKTSFIFVELTDYSVRIFFFQNGQLTFIRFIGVTKWKDKDKFIRKVSSQIHHSILYLNQQYPDANLDKFVILNRTSISDVVGEISQELEFTIEKFDFSKVADYSDELLEKLEEHYININSPLYASTLMCKNEAVPFPIRDFDVKIQKKIRNISAVIFFIFWILALGVGFFQLKGIVDKQKTVLDNAEDMTQKENNLLETFEKIEKKKSTYSLRHEALKKLIQAKSNWLYYLHGLLKIRPSSVLIEGISLNQAEAGSSEGGTEGGRGENQEKKIIRPLKMNLNIRIIDTFSKSLKIFENFKEQLQKYYKIIKSEPKESSEGSGKGFQFELVLSLKKIKN